MDDFSKHVDDFSKHVDHIDDNLLNNQKVNQTWGGYIFDFKDDQHMHNHIMHIQWKKNTRIW